jgi:hypothetical protein
MTKKKNHDTEDDEFDSNKHREANTAKIKAEAKETAEDKEIANFKGLPKEGETREQLLDRIRAMRDEKPVEATTELVRSEGLQKEFELEQAAGRAAVAKATEAQEKYQALQAEEAKGEKNKAGG